MSVGGYQALFAVISSKSNSAAALILTSVY
jgi:hypothetical protein